MWNLFICDIMNKTPTLLGAKCSIKLAIQSYKKRTIVANIFRLY